MSGSPKVALLLETLYNEQEFWYPYYRLREAGAEVAVVAPEAGATYHSKIGMPAVSTLAATDADTSGFDGVVIPGGYAPDHMRRHPAMVALVRDIFATGKPVAAICHAGWMLVSAGVLPGRRATCYPSIKDDLINAGGVYQDAEVVVDQNLITSRKPDDLPAFMREFLNALGRAGER